MDAIIKRENQPSPFDQIKQVDTDGNEYWLARELMPILGYQQWRQFEDAISRAIAACSNIEQESEKHFLRLTAKSTGGRPRDDFKLSRYGCYLTAMNGDPRKPEIAAAQSYFVVKTREAETQTQLKAMTQIQLLAALAQQLAEQEQHLLQQQQQQTEILHRLKAIEVEQDRVNTPCGHKYSVVGFANLQGLEISVKEAGTKGRKASALCRKQGIEIERIHDPRFGKVGLYPESVLIEVFSTGQN
ncbi:DNA-damage-inducible protein [Nostoc commune NIES-4072]|uniref:DNA-damage-inducible protein n=1 Tax=Nostoc commune NIES-4072 TaxID=2005467 RepID=A0A2R5FX61_NOSCO|nr:BRO family protein [Nostoc commune]BBD70701.1 DNA-damage-inducible protein [Nostoc commune HK-02]GBG23356.1 DNA-damage-inducible protein [Nostoc commune NIES-4072]